MQKYIYTLLAVASMALTACNEHNIPTPAELPTPGEGRTVTITATTGDNTDTRISYQEDDDNTSTNILWSEGDNFYLCYSGAGSGAAYLFEKEGSDESSTADFTCEGLPENSPPPGVTLYAIYPGNSEIKANATNLAIDFSTQDGKATGKHLMLAKLESNTIGDWDGIRFSFESNVALLKLTLKNEDFKGNDITNITVDATNLCGESVFKFENQSWTNETTGSITINAPITGDDEGNVTVYIAQPKSDVSTGSISINATCGGNLYSGTLDEGQFEGYYVYTAEADMSKMASMRFTVKPTAEQNEFTLPLKNDTGDYTLMVDWGDDSEITTIPSGTETTDDLLSHAYANTGGAYTITLTTTAPYTEAQMPRWSFFYNYSERMLVSMDSPMLNTASTDFSHCFYGCSNLTTIPAGLFENNTTVTDFSFCFSDCANLESIPDGLFDTNIAAEKFEYCFNCCSNLTSIPDGLFSNNTVAENFSYCFAYCYELTTIPDKLFATNTVATNFSYCFAYCFELTTIPTELFATNIAATSFRGCFTCCNGLATIPEGLFSNNTVAENFSYCFYACSELTTIPDGLFSNNTAIIDFSYCFKYCPELTTIPDELFANNFDAENFEHCFEECFNLTTIPDRLFSNNTVAENFSHCFYDCNSLASIPDGLFAANAAATNFSGCFAVCYNLTTIPDELFATNSNAENFEHCFEECYNLTTIPVELFAKNTAAVTFKECFVGCSNLKLNPDIFCNESTEKFTRFAGKIVDFTNCFFYVGSDFDLGEGGTAPALWEYKFGAVEKRGCFYGCTNVENYADIPDDDDWKKWR